jgi:hypothetical protein
MKYLHTFFQDTMFSRVAIVMFIVLAPIHVQAQDATPSTLLPDIDPQDIEIRGDFTIRFPGIMRQPILGFNPRPRVFQLDPNRMPFIESREQVVASLPISDLERPAPPAFQAYKKPERFRLWSSTGIGNYMAPEADVYLHIPIARRTHLGGKFYNFSSGSYLEEDTQTSSFRNMNGALNLVHFAGERSRFDVGFELRSDRNHLPQSPFLLPGSGTIENVTPDNNITNLGTQVGYRYNRNAASFWDIRLEASRFNAEVGQPERELPDLTIVTGYAVEQLRLSGGIRKDFALNTPGNTGMISVNSAYGSYTPDRDDNRQWFLADAGGAWRSRLRYNLKSDLGFRLYYGQHYDASQTEQSDIAFFPQASVQYDLTPDLRIDAGVSGFMYNRGYDGLSLTNRRLYSYAEPENERGLRFESGATVTLFEGLRVQSAFSFTRYGNYGYYSVLPGTRPYMTYAFEEGVNHVHWHLGAWYDLIPQTWNVFGSFYAQSVNDDDGTELPFHENVGFSAGSTYAFSPRARMQVWSDYKGPRNTGGFGPDAKGYFLMGAKFDFWASSDIGAYLKITNLFNQSYSEWVGYNELPTQVHGGIMFKF